MYADDGRKRVVVEAISPEIDAGRFPIKRTIGEKVRVEADAFTDGHDEISCSLRYRSESAREWSEIPMEFLVNDRWRAEFLVIEIGRYFYTVQGWVDHFKSWRRDLLKRIQAGQDAPVDYQIGAQLLSAAAARANGADTARLTEWARFLESNGDAAGRRALATSEDVAILMARYPDRRFATTYPRELPVLVERPRARFSAWYEFFPRSASSDPARPGTFRDCEARLPYVAEMGFDVVYFPPIHPIGCTYRKGRNNKTVAMAGEPGSPWAIGSEQGGHKSVHAELGTLEDFRSLVAKAGEYGIEIALDIAFQCSPDHPYVKEHPEWFRKRPDNTIQYAENPPKKYQDIYPFDFETDNWCSLWEELKSIVLFWTEQGVKIFRVDNPHTKSFRMWEWLIAEVRKKCPDAIFLAEAFTRPKVMYELAKLGFSQSYNYFPWRNTKWEITQYFTELTRPPVRDFFRPNLWPNTPDILTEYLQTGGKPAFQIRLLLAATLGASYGIYGPPFELCENVPREPGSEEYLNSEKYEIRHWDFNRPGSLKELIARVNRIRRENPALQSDASLRFHEVNNDQIVCYSKHTEDLSNLIVVAVNLDPHHVQAGWISLPAHGLGLPGDRAYQVHDLLGDARYLWHGARNYVELDPRVMPAQIFRIRRLVRTEKEFEYYM